MDNLNQPSVSHRFWDIKLQRYRVTTLTFWGHVDVIGHSRYAVSCRWSFETIALSRIVAEILCAKHLATHIPTENALIPIFCVLEGKIGGYNILQLCASRACSRSLGTSFELLTATIGPRASLLRYLDLPIENALRGWKIGEKYGKGHQIFNPLTKAFLLFGPLTCVQK